MTHIVYTHTHRHTHPEQVLLPNRSGEGVEGLPGNYFRTFGQQRRRPSGKKVAPFVKTPDGPRENYCKPCAIPAEAKDQEDASLGRRERSKEVNVFFVYLSTATARKIAKHTTRGGAFDVSRGWGGTSRGGDRGKQEVEMLSCGVCAYAQLLAGVNINLRCVRGVACPKSS